MGETAEKAGVGRPMEEAPQEEQTLALLYCSERGGWISAVRHEGRWRDFPFMVGDLTDYATASMPVPANPDEP